MENVKGKKILRVLPENIWRLVLKSPENNKNKNKLNFPWSGLFYKGCLISQWLWYEGIVFFDIFFLFANYVPI